MTFSIEHYRLDGKVAIVTGAGGRGNNIGRAYATGLAAAGAAVVVADINGEGAHLVPEGNHLRLDHVRSGQRIHQRTQTPRPRRLYAGRSRSGSSTPP